jgi:hypothetical protein
VRTTYHAKEAKDGSDEEEGGEELRRHHGWLFRDGKRCDETAINAMATNDF